ncbi:MAG: alpha/beta hydrolase [Alphaproteobacteria bacterium]|nr:alpha/beta hydrolase [Alphaproteobacteria bacterium]
MQALDQAMAEAVAAGTRFERIASNGIALHVARMGTGTPLVLLHGWPELNLVWQPVMRRLADRFAMAAPDLRGFGATGKPSDAPDAGATADLHAADLLGLADALGWQRFGLVAGDVGSFVAQAFALKHPERLAGMVLFSTVYPGIGRRYGAPAHLIEVWYQYFNQLPWAAQLVGSSREACRLFIKHFLDHWSGDDPTVFAPVLEAWVDNFMRPGNLQGGFDWYRASGPGRVLMLEERLPPRPKVATRTRFLWGKRDPLIKPEWSDKLGDYFADCSIAFLDAGHFAHFQAPDAASREIAGFFG